MKREYLGLQFRLVNRHISDAGLQPLAGWLLGILVFAGLTVILFMKTGYAPWVLTLLVPGALSRLSSRERNELIAMLFRPRDKSIIRITENLAATMPVAIVLASVHAWVPLTVALGTGIVMAGSVFTVRGSAVIPTPFGRWPYEFPSGFRRSWPAVSFGILICVMSVVSGNFNLAVFAQLFLAVVSIAFYLQADPEMYVWVFDCRPGRFLFRKIKVAAGCSTLLVSPVLIATMTAFPDRWWIPMIAHGLSLLYLSTVILLRYTSFPGEPGIPGLIIVALTVTFPPLLLVVIPYFGARAVRRLKPLLP